MHATNSAVAFAIGLLLSPNLAYASWFGDEQPPANAKPLSEIGRALEDQGYKTITEVEFDDGLWEIEIQQADGKEVHLEVDPISGSLASK